MRAHNLGYTLLEMMVAVALLAVISAIAVPIYQDYVNTARIGTLVNNIATIEVFQEDFRLRNGSYQAGVWNGAADAGLTALGWRPQDDDGTSYTITVAGATYDVTATSADGTTVCRRFPARIDCP
jgi:type IV pilus assembly protein PilE